MDLDVFEITKKLFKDYDKIFILDVNGILNYKPQLNLLKKLASNGKIWTDPGVRFSDDIIDPLVADIDKIIVSTKTLSNFDELDKAVELSEEIIVGIDYDDGIINHGIRTEVDLKDFERNLSNIDINKILLFDWLSMENLTKFNEYIIDNFRNKKYEIYIGGRISKSEVEFFETLGIKGVLQDWQNLIED